MNEETHTQLDSNWTPVSAAVAKILAGNARQIPATEIKPVVRREVGKVLLFQKKKGRRKRVPIGDWQECEVVDLLLRIQERMLLAQYRTYRSQQTMTRGFADP